MNYSGLFKEKGCLGDLWVFAHCVVLVNQLCSMWQANEEGAAWHAATGHVRGKKLRCEGRWRKLAFAYNPKRAVIDCRCSRPAGCKQKSGNCNCTALPVLLNGRGEAAGEGEAWEPLFGGFWCRRQPCRLSVALVVGLVWGQEGCEGRLCAASSLPVYTSTCVHIHWWLVLLTRPLAKEKMRCLPWPQQWVSS